MLGYICYEYYFFEFAKQAKHLKRINSRFLSVNFYFLNAMIFPYFFIVLRVNFYVQKHNSNSQLPCIKIIIFIYFIKFLNALIVLIYQVKTLKYTEIIKFLKCQEF